jgi:uncharacterized LabA/DUF88 family protein
MSASNDQLRFAVLIDADNAQFAVIDNILAEVAKYGVASVKRAYGDWTTTSLNGWKEKLNEHAIQPIQQFRYTTGKNSTDSALIIDAMDLLFSGRLQGFCLVSSDSDFTRLATRLREAGMSVLGIGEKKTPRAFVKSCDKFVYTEILRSEDKTEGSALQPPAKKDARELRADARLVKLIRSAVESCAQEDGWAFLSRVGYAVVKQSPDFDSRNYGYRKLLSLVVATDLFEIQERITKTGQTQQLIRDKRTQKSETGRKSSES